MYECHLMKESTSTFFPSKMVDKYKFVRFDITENRLLLWNVSGTVFKNFLGPLYVFCHNRHTLHVLMSIRFRRDGDRQPYQAIYTQTHDFCVRKVSNYFSVLPILFFLHKCISVSEKLYYMFYLSIFLALFQDSKRFRAHQGNAGLRSISSPPTHAASDTQISKMNDGNK